MAFTGTPVAESAGGTSIQVQYRPAGFIASGFFWIVKPHQPARFYIRQGGTDTVEHLRRECPHMIGRVCNAIAQICYTCHINLSHDWYLKAVLLRGCRFFFRRTLAEDQLANLLALSN
jgi:hypothetical protein